MSDVISPAPVDVMFISRANACCVCGAFAVIDEQATGVVALNVGVHMMFPKFLAFCAEVLLGSQILLGKVKVLSDR